VNCLYSLPKFPSGIGLYHQPSRLLSSRLPGARAEGLFFQWYGILYLYIPTKIPKFSSFMPFSVVSTRPLRLNGLRVSLGISIPHFCGFSFPRIHPVCAHGSPHAVALIDEAYFTFSFHYSVIKDLLTNRVSSRYETYIINQKKGNLKKGGASEKRGGHYNGMGTSLRLNP
jgi:hypothetical protein